MAVLPGLCRSHHRQVGKGGSVTDTVMNSIGAARIQDRTDPDGTKANERKHRRILFRTVMMAWLIVIFTVAIFIAAVIPYLRRQLVAEMRQRALVVYTSTAQMTVESIVMDDFSAVVDHCMGIVNQNTSVLYIVITRKDGFSLIHNQGAWRQENLKGLWRPAVGSIPGQGRFMDNPLGNGQTFHLSYAVNYMGVEWGWIHLGLSTDKFHKDERTFYLQLAMIAAIAVSAGFFLSLINARRLSIPILNLERFARRIASGDLSQRIHISTGDEVEKLAHSFNYMVDALQQAKQERKVAQQKLVETARLAGMAEMVSNVLHNVGNAINSVGVATSTMHRRVSQSRIASLTHIAALIEEQGDAFADYLTTDPQGRKVPAYLCSLSDYLAKEQSDLLNDLQILEQHMQHVRDIIHLQQDYSRTRGLTDPVLIETIIEDALQFNREAIAKFDIRIEKHYAPLSQCLLDRHKLMQILINLFSNAYQAVATDETGPGIVRVVLKQTEPDRVCIEVSDNGIGIATQNMTRIFQHGFTTRANGHGFGLHSSAIAAAELGGSLRAKSDGIGKGATFVLNLPFRPKEMHHGSD
jgi:signal transduction histidine kinase